MTMTAAIPESFEFLFSPHGEFRYRAAFGGRGSGKSHSFASGLVIKARQRPLRILCCREVQRSIKDSSKRLLDDKIAEFGFGSFFGSVETEIRGDNGSFFVFAGLRTNPDTIKSGEGYDIAWIDEANRVSQTSLDILRPTLRNEGSEIWFSWNPGKATDPVDALMRGEAGPPPRSIVREVNWDDNPFFPTVLREEMEWDRRRDPEKFAHIWGGQYLRRSEATVFRNWRIDRFETPDNVDRFYYGADWGFSVDPTVLVRCYINGRTLYIDREVYRIGCEIDRTPALFDTIENGHARNWPITADSARPETISFMRRNGYPHISGALKGAGSVEEGVEFLKSFDIIVHPDCQHTADELTLYSYKVDKQTDEVLPALEDKKNHVIDALRYAVESIRRSPREIDIGTPVQVGDAPSQNADIINRKLAGADTRHQAPQGAPHLSSPDIGMPGGNQNGIIGFSDFSG